jgi:hypothetical protein
MTSQDHPFNNNLGQAINLSIDWQPALKPLAKHRCSSSVEDLEAHYLLLSLLELLSK